MKNPTPFLFAHEVKWSNGFLPARVYIRAGSEPIGVFTGRMHHIASGGGKTKGVPNPYSCGKCVFQSHNLKDFSKLTCKPIKSTVPLIESLDSGFSGVILDSEMKPVGSIRRSIRNATNEK